MGRCGDPLGGGNRGAILARAGGALDALIEEAKHLNHSHITAGVNA